MLRIHAGPRLVWRDVLVRSARDGGGQDVAKFRAQLRLLTADELRGLASDGEADGDTDRVRLLLSDHVADWADVVDDDGSVIPFSAERLGAVLNDIPIRAALMDELITASGGGAVKKT